MERSAARALLPGRRSFTGPLGHPARVQIVRLLVRRQACICGDIVEELPLAQSTVSQHLKVLKEAGLIRGEIGEPCLRFHVRRGHEAGLSEEQLRAAVAVACKVKETPARHILEAAERLLAPGALGKGEGSDARCCG
jgi:DNA-binding transcriptional ArsR family regulator